MKIAKIGAALVMSGGLAGCVTNDAVTYHPSESQQQIVRDGVPALVSEKPKSVVILRPAGRGIAPGERAVYVVAIRNLTKMPVNMRVADIQVVQTKEGQYARALPVKTYEQLVEEERTRQVFAGIAVGLGAAANSYSASQAGYGHSSGTATVHGPYGTYTGTVHTTYYSPAARQIAIANANAENSRNIAAFAHRSEANLAALEAEVLKDNTIMPGEWIGGTVTFEAPRKEFAVGKAKTYSIAIKVGDEMHVIEAVQAPPPKA